MSNITFSLIKTCALISNTLFHRVERLTFRRAVNAHRQSNMASTKRIAYCAHIRGKIINILTEMGHLHI